MKHRSAARNQESNIGIALRRALMVALAAPATVFVAQACSSTSSGGGGSTSPDASLADSGSDGGGAPADAGPCTPKTIYVDAQAPDGGIECGIFQQFPCGLPAPLITPDSGTDSGLTLFDDCFFLLNDCPNVCPGALYFNCHVYGDACDGGIINQAVTDPLIVECASCPNGVGRKPHGLQSPRAPRPTGNKSRRANDNALGKYFASAAHLEAASIHAFRILRRELASYRAPRDLLDAAKRAEADEVKHARMTTRIARSHGAKPPKVHVKRGARRSLEEVALENAVEGCVRETFGALVAMWQAERARDSDIAAAMKEIAIDETRHAALAWNVAAWADEQLDAKARKRVNTAKNKAIRDLEKEIAVEAHPDLVAQAGVPNRVEQRRLFDALSRGLFAKTAFAGADFET